MNTPRNFDVVLAENLFGDILSDEAAVITGSLGMLPSATIGGAVNLYEPVHGSAPDIAGKGVANPLGAILTAAMLLRYSANLEEDAQAVELAVRRVLDQGYRTADLTREPGQRVSTQEMGKLVHQTLHEMIDRRHALHAV
jgi:3-isopropylmalate dehydrogenase